MDSCQSSKLQLIVPRADQPAERELSLIVQILLIMRALRKRFSNLTQIILRFQTAGRMLTLLLQQERGILMMHLTFLGSEQSTMPQRRDKTTQTRPKSPKDATSLTQKTSRFLHSALTLLMVMIATRALWLISAMSFQIFPQKSWVARSGTACSHPRPVSRSVCEFFGPVMKSQDEFCGGQDSPGHRASNCLIW